MKYTTHKRFKAKGIDGDFNLPYGTLVEYDNGFLFHDGRRICRATSENGYEHFHEDSPEGECRHEMITVLAEYYKNGGDVSDVYFREFASSENDYWLHILRTMDTPRLTVLCLKRLGKIPT